MSPERFRQAALPEGVSLALQALWHDAQGDWARAHACAQAQEDAAGAAVHAYLHRREGDLANAGYWYRRAGRAVPRMDLAAEWRALAAEFLAEAAIPPQPDGGSRQAG